MFSGIHLTTPLVWFCTMILVFLDCALVLLAWHSVTRPQINSMRWLLTIAGGVFFLLVWTSVLLWGWEWFYAYIFPPWARFTLPIMFGIGYAIIAFAMAWLSVKIKGSSAVTWCVLGGLEGLVSHIYAIYGLGAASKPPIMQGTNPFAVLVFAIFEKAFYWSIILLVTWFLSKRLFHKIPHPRDLIG